MKAFIVEVEDHDIEIVFADTAGQARGRGCTEYDFMERKVRRVPYADSYAPGPVPKQVLIANGWWFECSARGCQNHVCEGEGAVIAGKPYCEEHAALSAKEANAGG